MPFVSENIAKIIYGDQFEERKDEITKTMAAGTAPNGEKLRGNHETVMTVLCGPKTKSSQVVKKKPKLVQKAGVGRNQDLTYRSVMPKVDPSRLDNSFQQEFRHFVR
ncbi:hypothetical protein TELCIR_12347 [Teladorsagia circumcincta]|uniref:Uncharacterized protein n=1 Tax=Teladorsagia circumcincta TaxID=45464 RepID=A0A2G9U6T4_TELCI|nr:hypothetical protein TELCIR_12347 [Teladorsagia circumcincta]